jgi:outer membrane lipopolysaccharide assembly protein LptE/RlpB
MEGALRQLGCYLKAARKLSRQGADYSRVNEEDKERIVETTDMIFREDIAEDEITTMVTASEDKSRRLGDSLCPPVTTLAKDNLSPPVTSLAKDEKQELIDETLAALRSLDELGERMESVRRENRLLRKAKRALQRRPLESASLSCPLIAGP